MRSLVVALVLLILLVVLGAYTSALTLAPQGAHNTNPQGSNLFFSVAMEGDAGDETPLDAVRFIHGPMQDLDPTRESLVILAPQVAYRDTQVERIDRFLDAGGRVLIVDEDQAGRHLVARLDRGVTISSAPVYSTSYQSDPLRPLVESTGVLPGLPDQVELPGTHAVEGEGVALLRAHELSWLDLDHDGRPGLGEPQGAFATARLVDAGDGELLVAAFPALFENERAGSQETGVEPTRNAFYQWLTSDGRTIAVHEGNRGHADPLNVQTALSEEPSMVHAAVILGAVGIVVLTAFNFQLYRTRPPRRVPVEQRTRDPATRRVVAELPFR